MVLFAILAGLEALILLSIHALPLHPAVALGSAFVSSSAVYVVLARRLGKTEFTPAALAIILLASLLVRAGFLTTAPIGSDDFYRYLWDGKLQSHGINPYRYAPSAQELRPFHSETLPANVNHPEMTTVYFPFVQWFFALSYQITGESILGFKILLLLAECATLWLLRLLLDHLRLPRKLILLYALCPLPILQFSLDAHLDGLGLPFLAASLLLFGKGRSVWSLLVLSLSISVKPVGLVLLPLWFFRERGIIARIRSLAIPALILGLQFIPYSFGVNPLEGLRTFTEHWMFNGMAFSIIYAAVADNQTARLLCAVLLAGILILLTRSRREWVEKAYLALLALLLCSPVVHPWYVGWLALLVPLARRWSGVAYVSTACLTAVTVTHYILTGIWVEYPFVLVLEYLPVLLLLFAEIRWGNEPRWRLS
jgi:hypothetical protein